MFQTAQKRSEDERALIREAVLRNLSIGGSWQPSLALIPSGNVSEPAAYGLVESTGQCMVVVAPPPFRTPDIKLRAGSGAQWTYGTLVLVGPLDNATFGTWSAAETGQIADVWNPHIRTDGPEINPCADREWFYSDPERVQEYQGQVVAVSGEEVVGVGATTTEAFKQAKAAGVSQPLILRVPVPQTDAPDFEIGL